MYKRQRPPRAADPEAYDGGWVTQADAGPILRENLAKRLAADGIAVENLAYTAKMCIRDSAGACGQA